MRKRTAKNCSCPSMEAQIPERALLPYDLLTEILGGFASPDLQRVRSPREVWRVGCFSRRQGQNGMHACLQSVTAPSLVHEPAAQPWPGACQDPCHLLIRVCIFTGPRRALF